MSPNNGIIALAAEIDDGAIATSGASRRASPSGSHTGKQVASFSFLPQGKCIPLSLVGSLVLELELGEADDCFLTTTNRGFSWSLERI